MGLARPFLKLKILPGHLALVPLEGYGLGKCFLAALSVLNRKHQVQPNSHTDFWSSPKLPVQPPVQKGLAAYCRVGNDPRAPRSPICQESSMLT